MTEGNAYFVGISFCHEYYILPVESWLEAWSISLANGHWRANFDHVNIILLFSAIDTIVKLLTFEGARSDFFLSY